MRAVGARLFGNAASFDYDLELAYQFGNADSVGFGFKPTGFLYGDDDADFDAWAGDLEVGYSIEMAWNPRVYIGGAYFEGEDNRDLTFLEWLNPFYRSEASVSFNRMFPGKPYSMILEIGQDMSNFWQTRRQLPTPPEAVTGAASGPVRVDETFDAPVTITPPLKIPVAPALSLTDESSGDIGVTAHAYVNYQYPKTCTSSLAGSICSPRYLKTEIYPHMA